MNDINAAAGGGGGALRGGGGGQVPFRRQGGPARQRQAIVERVKRFVPNEKDIMDKVLVTHYFDTRDNGATTRSSTVFIQHGPNAVRAGRAEQGEGDGDEDLLEAAARHGRSVATAAQEGARGNGEIELLPLRLLHDDDLCRLGLPHRAVPLDGGVYWWWGGRTD
ncbi:hypothetical protein E2562_005965 [Oryza meyeriana var. granulata]|uniref:Uncharacterized protein n=1 Tax=Oryza meyeriana var. granulata TaxID=110450 RepID=A0A6G1DV25_9ORYZ|nr:hypothetical protein E2562_005965 [Oryza meyeriana var. granulata]